MNRATIVAFCQIICIIFFFGSWLYYVISQIEKYGKWELLLFFVCLPFAAAFSIFPINFFVNNIINLFYPASKLQEDSKYYSFMEPAWPQIPQFPNVSIHIPIYTEDFEEVIIPTLESAIIARDKYHGICNIVIADDGFCVFLMNENKVELAQQRLQWYEEHDIGFVARPVKGRRGKFKKASNLNNLFGNDPQPLKHGNIDVGEYIIILDADSRMPEDSIQKGINYMILHENVGFIQFATTPLANYKDNCFSRQIGRFTKNLYKIVFPIVTRGGEPAPLVGHNAMLRYKAMDESKIEEGVLWHENRVSEDFDLSIRMQMNGYIGIYATFCEYEEGVSLAYADELSKLSKFAYGASELMWSKNFIKYWKCNNIPWASKVNLSAYLFSYYAIASAIVVAPIHLALTCYIEDWYKLTMEPVVVMIFSIILFTVLGPLSSMSILYRTQNSKTVLTQLWHGIFMLIFYTSVPFSIFRGIISHIFCLNASWGATRKTINDKESLIEIIIQFKWQYTVMILYTIFMGFSLWGICSAWYGYIPIGVMILGHLINPILMNTHIGFCSK